MTLDNSLVPPNTRLVWTLFVSSERLESVNYIPFFLLSYHPPSFLSDCNFLCMEFYLLLLLVVETYFLFLYSAMLWCTLLFAASSTHPRCRRCRRRRCPHARRHHFIPLLLFPQFFFLSSSFLFLPRCLRNILSPFFLFSALLRIHAHTHTRTRIQQEYSVYILYCLLGFNPVVTTTWYQPSLQQLFCRYGDLGRPERSRRWRTTLAVVSCLWRVVQNKHLQWSPPAAPRCPAGRRRRHTNLSVLSCVRGNFFLALFSFFFNRVSDRQWGYFFLPN